MTCDICGKEIPRGKRYIGEKYKAEHFCSEECYLQRKPKNNQNIINPNNYYRRTTDYIKAWLDPYEPSWPFIAKQIQSIKQDFNVDDKYIYALLKFCHEYKDVKWNSEYGLYQFLKYTKEMEEFQDSILHVAELANQDNGQEEYYVVFPSKKNIHVWLEELDF